jgi:hypothetical protein
MLEEAVADGGRRMAMTRERALLIGVWSFSDCCLFGLGGVRTESLWTERAGMMRV